MTMIQEGTIIPRASDAVMAALTQIKRPAPVPWPEAAVTTLMQLWPTHTATQIAKILGPSFTRNAVLSKVDRMRDNGVQIFQEKKIVASSEEWHFVQEDPYSPEQIAIQREKLRRSMATFNLLDARTQERLIMQAFVKDKKLARAHFLSPLKDADKCKCGAFAVPGVLHCYDHAYVKVAIR